MEGLLPLLIFAVLAVAAYLWLKRPKKLDLSILPSRFIVADIETTGLNPDKHEIIEIAAVMVNRDSDRHDYWRAVVKPSKKVPPEDHRDHRHNAGHGRRRGRAP